MKMIFDTEHLSAIQKELQRIVKSEWFSSGYHVNLEELLATNEKNDVKMDSHDRDTATADQEDDAETVVSARPHSAAGGFTTTSARVSGVHHNDNGNYQLPRHLRESLMYKNLLRLKEKQEGSELFRAHRPSTAPSSICKRALVAERPTASQLGMHLARHVKKYSSSTYTSAPMFQSSRPSTAATTATTGTSAISATSATTATGRLRSAGVQRPTTADDMLSLRGTRLGTPASASSTRTTTTTATRTMARPYSAFSTMSTVQNETIANRARIEGIVPKKRRKIFATLVHANNAKKFHGGGSKQAADTDNNDVDDEVVPAAAAKPQEYVHLSKGMVVVSHLPPPTSPHFTPPHLAPTPT